MNTRAREATVLVAAILIPAATLFFVLRPPIVPKQSLGILAGVPAFEVPDLAARLVRQTPKAEQPAMAREIIRRVSVLPEAGVTPFAVSAICQAAPEATGDTIGTAVRLQPAQTRSIVQAAWRVAPATTLAFVADWDRRFAGVPVTEKGYSAPSAPRYPISLQKAPPRDDLPFTARSGPSTELNIGNGTAARPDTTRDYSAP